MCAFSAQRSGECDNDISLEDNLYTLEFVNGYVEIPMKLG